MNRSCAATTSISLRAQRRNNAFDRSFSAISTQALAAERSASCALPARAPTPTRAESRNGDHESRSNADRLRARPHQRRLIASPLAMMKGTPQPAGEPTHESAAPPRAGARSQRPANATHHLRPAGRSGARHRRRQNNDVATSQPKLAAITRHRPGGRPSLNRPELNRDARRRRETLVLFQRC